MDAKRRKELYAQLRAILMELLYDHKPLPRMEQHDDSALRIHLSESVGAREKMM